MQGGDVNKNLELWNKMNDSNGFMPGDAVLRMKTEISPKSSFQGIGRTRIQTNPHPRVGSNVFGYYLIFNPLLRTISKE